MPSQPMTAVPRDAAGHLSPGATLLLAQRLEGLRPQASHFKDQEGSGGLGGLEEEAEAEDVGLAQEGPRVRKIKQDMLAVCAALPLNSTVADFDRCGLGWVGGVGSCDVHCHADAW